MEHIDGLGELGHIEHAPFTQHVYSNFPDTRPTSFMVFQSEGSKPR